MKMRTLVVPLVVCGALVGGCKPKPPETPKIIDADFDSGPDSKRSGALPMPINTPVTDNVNFDKGDQTDWKVLELKGKPGILAVEAHWDNAASDLNVDVFDSLGTQIASSPQGSGNPEKKLVVQIEQLGVYYLRVQAPRPHDNTDYTLVAKWDAPVVEEAPAAAPPKKEEHHKEARTPSAHREPRKKGGGGRPEDGVQGRIVSTYHEGGNTVLYLDKGAAAGVAEGQNGWILDGPSGASPLDNGGFTVTKVVDDGRSVAKTKLNSVGKNTRVSINTGK